MIDPTTRALALAALIISVIALVETHLGNLIALSDASSNVRELERAGDIGRQLVIAFGCFDDRSDGPAIPTIRYIAFTDPIFTNRGGRDVSLVDVQLTDSNSTSYQVRYYPNIDSENPTTIDVPIDIPAGKTLSLSLRADHDEHYPALQDAKRRALKLLEAAAPSSESVTWIYSFSDGTELRKTYSGANFSYRVGPSITEDLTNSKCEWGH